MLCHKYKYIISDFQYYFNIILLFNIKIYFSKYYKSLYFSIYYLIK